MHSSMTPDWPAFRLARELAGTVFPVSEATILEAARKYGIGRKLGRSIIFGPDDCNRLYQVLPCPSKSSNDRNHQTGSFAAPSAESALKKALALASDGSPKKSARSEKRNCLRNPSTAVVLPLPSQKQP